MRVQNQVNAWFKTLSIKWPLSAEKYGLYPKGSKAASHNQENIFELSWLNLKNSCEVCVVLFIMHVCVCLNIQLRNCLFLYNGHIKLTTKEDEVFTPECHGPLGSPVRPLAGSTPWLGSHRSSVPVCYGVWLNDFILRHRSLPFLTWRNTELSVRPRWAC